MTKGEDQESNADRATEEARTRARDDTSSPTKQSVDPAKAPTVVAPSTLAGSARDPKRQRPRDSQVDLHPGDRLGDRYVIRGFLGFGGMGAVYHAFDEILGEDVALKAVRSALAADESLRDEVRLAQRVTHENVCRTYDLEDLGGRHFVKMEYLDGTTLASRIDKDGKLPVASAVTIARAIASGLAAAHARGIVHRDLKPGNVMLAGDRVVLMDFGLARYSTTDTSDRAGTPSYMSPEQLEGRGVDARSDLFALGCVLHEMLTGERPFGSGSLTQIANRQATAPLTAKRVTRLPRWLGRATKLLLSLDPGRRTRGLSLLVRGPRRAWLIAAAVAVVALAGIGIWWSKRPWTPSIVNLTQFEENSDSPAFSPDGKTLAFPSDRGHPGVWAVYTIPIRGETAHQLSPPGIHCTSARWMRDGRSVLMACDRDDEPHILRQPIDGGPYQDLGQGSLADDCGDRILIVTRKMEKYELTLRAPSGESELATSVDGAILGASCDSTGTRIEYEQSPVIGAADDVYVFDRTTKVTTQVTSGGFSGRATFTRGGKSLVIAMLYGNNFGLYEVSLDGSSSRALTPNEEHAQSPDVSPDGTQLVFDRDVTSQPLVTVDAQQHSQQVTFRIEFLSHVSQVPGTRTVLAEAFSYGGSHVLAIDLEDGAERELTAGRSPFPSRDGHRVLYSDPYRPERLRAMPVAGGAAQAVAELPAAIVEGIDAVDGQHVLVGTPGSDLQAYRIAPDGRIEAEPAQGLVMPSPSGAWRVVQRREVSRDLLQFVAPGRPLDQPDFTRESLVGRPVWIDDHDFAYCDPKHCHVLDVTTQRDELIDVALSDVEVGVALDGRHWYTTPYRGHVTRHLITNFGERPWKP